jgi:hypothetical protein
MPAKAGISTPRLLSIFADISGILDHPLSRIMTAANGSLNKKRRHRCRRFVLFALTSSIN